MKRMCKRVILIKDHTTQWRKYFVGARIVYTIQKYFVELRAITKYKLCYVEIFPNKEDNVT